MFAKPERPEQCGTAEPAQEMAEEKPDEGAGGVDAHIFRGGSSSGDQALVELVGNRIEHADDFRREDKFCPADPVHIERDGKGEGEKEVFRHVRGLADIVLEAYLVARNLLVAPLHIEGAVDLRDHAAGDVEALRCAFFRGLGGKVENHHHDHDGRGEGERFQQISKRELKEQQQVFHLLFGTRSAGSASAVSWVSRAVQVFDTGAAFFCDQGFIITQGAHRQGARFADIIL